MIQLSRSRLLTGSFSLLGSLTLAGALAPWGSSVQSLAIVLSLPTLLFIFTLEAEQEANNTKQSPEAKPWLLDTSVFIDGRIKNLVDLGLIDQPLITPSFVQDELQFLADRSQRKKRERGRRGLEFCSALKEQLGPRFSIHQSPKSDLAVDERLIALAGEIKARVMSVDSGLVLRAKSSGVDALNLHDLAKAMQIPVIPGAEFELEVIRKGDNKNQGVGYLEDGTMVVIEKGASHVGETVEVEVTSSIRTRNGPLIFTRILESKEKEDS